MRSNVGGGVREGGGDADRGWTDALSVMVSLVAVTKCVTS